MDRKYKILVVDDEQDLCEILRFNLETEGYDVATANSAEEALQLDLASFDLLLLDVMMGGMSGFALAEKLKNADFIDDLPIIFLTARDTENDTVTGLCLGADDYITKPFSVRELLLRVKAVLRRTNEAKSTKNAHFIEVKGLRINLDLKSVEADGVDVPMTRTEYELLRLLAEERGKVFSRQELINRIWPRDVYVLDRTVDVNITRLRKKLGPYARYLLTRPGFGYYFEEP